MRYSPSSERLSNVGSQKWRPLALVWGVLLGGMATYLLYGVSKHRDATLQATLREPVACNCEQQNGGNAAAESGSYQSPGALATSNPPYADEVTALALAPGADPALAFAAERLKELSAKLELAEERAERWESMYRSLSMGGSSNHKDRVFKILPPGIIHSSTNFYPRNLWGLPADDPKQTQTCLLVLTVGWKQAEVVDKLVQKFDPEMFQVVLFHYDNELDKWSKFDWFNNAIHVSVRKQTKWWYAKRFLHPDVVGAYDYIFLWDEDIGVETFDPRRYVEIVSENGLEISQPAVGKGHTSWRMTLRQPGRVFHQMVQGKGCETHAAQMKPPCGAYVEIMVPVISRYAWQCVWYLIQNDLVHSWGIDLRWLHCAANPERNKTGLEAMGVVDEQYVAHLTAPSLGNQGEAQRPGEPSWQGVSQRRQAEWRWFDSRWTDAKLELDELETLKETAGH